jgi:hypothetical protein
VCQHHIMKPSTPLVLFLTALSIFSGYLFSKASLVGKVGMSLFYQEYNFLKTWWKGAFLVFAVLMILLIIQGLLQRRLAKKAATGLHTVLVIVAVAALYLTYYDFRHTLSHRLLGERFHIGAYLFWLGWIVISMYYLVSLQAGGALMHAGKPQHGIPEKGTGAA